MTAALRRSFVWTSILALFFDQLTKTIVYGIFNKPGAPISIRLLGDILKISYTTNPYGVFGISFGTVWLHLILQLIGIIIVLVLGFKTSRSYLGCAYGIILGGALGNLIDRLRLGYVIDFIDFEIPALHFRWFTFNPADAFIVIGLILILIYEFITGVKQKSRKERKNEDACLSGQQLHNPD
jgi:signal peptidase II|uniref:Lipoprotein signal peptidase n=1 Tax=candidate division WOR-3 bacterium TaxID=2052148 RepID=A0A7V3PTB5_UNCW3